MISDLYFLFVHWKIKFQNFARTSGSQQTIVINLKLVTSHFFCVNLKIKLQIFGVLKSIFFVKHDELNFQFKCAVFKFKYRKYRKVIFQKMCCKKIYIFLIAQYDGKIKSHIINFWSFTHFFISTRKVHLFSFIFVSFF